MISVAHNLQAMNLQRQYGVSTKKDKKVTERLSSGYRINRAADDAAGLTISEKMRQQIRGLNQGTDNAQDGVSWVQIGDGALNEVHDMLHRMTELSVEAQNGTHTDADRAAMEAEFNQLQHQIDNISQNTKFNTKDIFSEHEPTFYQVEGNISWPHDATHYVYSPNNTLVVSYRENKDDEPSSVTITVPEGTYTTKELADEIDDAVANTPLSFKPKFNFEYTGKGSFNANLEGGVRIESLSGGLSSLLNETYSGGSAGALIGTTVFSTEGARLLITAGKNDHMTFEVEDFSGGISTKSLTLSPGRYTRNEIIDQINSKLAGTGISAKKYGTGIMLSGDDCIISKFKGNMFQIDGASYTSVFYDNVYHGEVSLTAGTFTGGAVLPRSSYENGRDVEHSAFSIKNGVNDQLTFKPNGSDTAVTITIPEGRYQIGDMKTKLNELFTAKGLDLTADFYSSGNYSGLNITSKLKGATSDVGLDASSSAFDTLFVNRTRNVYGSQASFINETTADRNAYYYGGKSFSDSSYDNVPLSVVTGSNDTFRLNIDGHAYNISIASNSYSSAEAIADAINYSMSHTDLGSYAGKVEAVADGGHLRLRAKDGSGIVNLTATNVSGNSGFADIFTTSYKLTTRIIGGQSASLDRVFLDPDSISESERYIYVESADQKVGYNLELPTGSSVSHQDIIDKIATQNGRTTYSDIKYSPSYTNGTDSNFASTANGQTSSPTVSDNNTGITVGGGIEGQVGGGYTVNTPATVTINLKSSFTPAAGSDEIRLKINGREELFTFEHKAYTPASFATELQNKINAVYGDKYGGATVTSTGNGVKITARLFDEYGTEMPANETNISYTSGNSSLLRELNTTRTPAVYTTPNSPAGALLPNSGINVNAGDTFVFSLNGVQKTVNLTALSNGSGSDFAAMLNNCLAAQNIDVTASAVRYNSSGYQLRLTSKATGSGNTIYYSSKNGGTVSAALYRDLTTAGTATASGVRVKDSISIEEGKNVFRYSVDGIGKSVTLDAKTYTRSQFLDELNSKLQGASASINNGYLTLTSNTKGTSSKILMPYDTASDSAMRAIWGQNEHHAPALTASFDPTNHLVLTSRDGTEFRISSAGTAMVEQNRTPVGNGYSSNTGYTSTKHATIDGGPLTISDSNPLVIDEWNDTLKFNYFQGSLRIPVSVNVDHGTYTSYDALRDNLQAKLDGALGSGEVSVTADLNGVVISAVKAGSTRYIGTPSSTSKTTSPRLFGDFYDKVMNRTTETTDRMSTSSSVGSNVAGTGKLPYVVGRRNVKDKPVTIKSDINDTLTLDFKYPGGGTKTFSMKLDTGTYQGSSLANMIQNKLNDQLESAGLSKNLIEVSIGGTSAVVAGVDNDKVLTFKLSNSLPLPGSGEYVIDAIGGNAAFSVFYQTTGELVPAYIEGVKNINEGVVIEDGYNVLSFSVDGKDYSLEIPPGEYTGPEMIDTLNGLLSGKNAPVKAEMTDDGELKISHKKMGAHPITGLSGSARGSLFFNEYGGEDEDRSINIQYSSMIDDNRTIDRPTVNTAFLGINSVTITKPKYAGKALERINGALERVSEVRSYFGAAQNAIEHVINRNNNTSENTQAAESRIRDTEMSSAVVEHAKNLILMQAGEAMLSQAKMNSQSVLQLLQ